MIPEPSSSDWYYIKEGTRGRPQTGPVGLEELRGLTQAGALTPDDLVWHSSLSQWAPAGQVGALWGHEANHEVEKGGPAAGWHVTIDRTTYGPYDWDQIVDWVRDGHIGPDHLLWSSQLPEWVPAQRVAGLFSADAQYPARPAASLRQEVPSSGAQTGSDARSFADGLARAAGAGSHPYGAMAQAAGVAGMGFSLPWQRVVGAGKPDVGALLSAAAIPGLQGTVGRSLKRPGMALAATTVLDFAAAWITGGTSAVYLALPRLVLSGSTSLLSVATGSKGGRVRKVTGIFAGVAGIAQLGFALYTLVSGLGSDTSAAVLVPQLVAMLASLVMATKTMLLALRSR